MCRMAILPRGYKGNKIVALLDHLEDAMGGDGNGFGYFTTDKVAKTIKGLKVKNSLIDKLEPGSDIVLYHTRKASAGDTSDANTQPFITVDKNKKGFLLCHNGTWTSHAEYKKILLMLGDISVEAYKTWSDTKFMAWLIEHQGEDRLDLPASGVWIQAYPDHAIVHVRSGDWQGVKMGKKWIFASEFPKTADYQKVWDFKTDSVIQCSPTDGFKVISGDKATHDSNESYVSPYVYNADGILQAGGRRAFGYYPTASTTKLYYYDKDGLRKEFVEDVDSDLEKDWKY